MLTATYFDIEAWNEPLPGDINLFNLSLSVIGLLPILLYVLLIINDLFGIFM
jgi:hypothetical protein